MDFFLLLFMDIFKNMILYADFRPLEIQGVQLNFLNESFLIIKNTYL